MLAQKSSNRWTLLLTAQLLARMTILYGKTHFQLLPRRAECASAVPDCGRPCQIWCRDRVTHILKPRSDHKASWPGRNKASLAWLTKLHSHSYTYQYEYAKGARTLESFAIGRMHVCHQDSSLATTRGTSLLLNTASELNVR